jgi:hypothetical protein
MRFFNTRRAVAVAVLSGAILGVAHAASNTPPSEAQVAFAQRTSDLMTNTVVAALLQEINETTPENVSEGNLSIGLIFNDRNEDMRLVGTMDPLSENDRPQDAFENEALGLAMTGQPLTSVERVKGQWYFRRSIPLSNFKPQCAMCHANFKGLPETAPVGALMLRIPIQN